ncbi:hypothetical protein FOCG_11559 [Fusarium oxysporum f. sp. radicis-lycopersici 26381]|uniref:Uncharacterized protein n=2 Tax=Fusarium oxysporum TaxID=5507 RepID=A0A4Q2W4R2_FUSOX|nr:hypothetical protein FOWG_12307 [Fusarium oxysporum f. sp. lycopersici MN25]EXL47368.1 hypothetical protein FOCG_11559 [Fusarium oxysporum f. sp. radicis-lycopersici 26381]RKK25407.1 hypothetical protein BFJ65_g3314 [Fusarium oxysporum f. sp. cepae]RKL31942.1 hypothetical protein BFJ70_g9264 [Fusarium oxysporum]RYC94727.1 hypothetical protein BFJ63_vAg2598 [Fusarium oxysporum f. sp. narcissi]
MGNATATVRLSCMFAKSATADIVHNYYDQTIRFPPAYEDPAKQHLLQILCSAPPVPSNTPP